MRNAIRWVLSCLAVAQLGATAPLTANPSATERSLVRTEVMAVRNPATDVTKFMLAVDETPVPGGRIAIDRGRHVRHIGAIFETDAGATRSRSDGPGPGSSDEADGRGGARMPGRHPGALVAQHVESLRRFSALEPVFDLKDRVVSRLSDRDPDAGRLRFPFFGFDNRDKKAWHQPAAQNIPQMTSMVDDPHTVTPAQPRYFAGYRLSDPMKHALDAEWYLAVGLTPNEGGSKPRKDDDGPQPFDRREPGGRLSGTGPAIGVVGKF